MTINEVQAAISELKKQRDICILAHSYQAREILEIADLTGDSYALSVAASKVKSKTVIMCGVRFMAETVKLLSPDKTVFLAHPDAGCPMADNLGAAQLQKAIDEHPSHAVVCYINTTAEVKAMSDVCVTSSSAVKILRAMPERDILFVPDCNLGAYVASQVPEKNVKLIEGGCPVHAAVTGEEALAAKTAHPDAPLLVHPECSPEVAKLADYVGSTSGIYDFAVSSDKREFIIGTEISIAEHLQFACPDKRFYALSKKLLCSDMRLTTLMDVYDCVRGIGGEELRLPPEQIAKSRRCIDEMIRLGG